MYNLLISNLCRFSEGYDSDNSDVLIFYISGESYGNGRFDFIGRDGIFSYGELNQYKHNGKDVTIVCYNINPSKLSYFKQEYSHAEKDYNIKLLCYDTMYDDSEVLKVVC